MKKSGARVKQRKTLVLFSVDKQKHHFRSTFSNLNLLTFNSHFEPIKQREIHISGKCDLKPDSNKSAGD